MDTVDIVKALLDETKTSQKKLALFLGVHPPHLSSILKRKGRYFSNSDVKKIAEYFNKTTDDILGTSHINEKKVKSIPLIGLASCGIPQDYDLNGYDPIPVSEDIYQDGMYAVQAEGNSMSPKINNSSIVYCNVNRQIDNGDIVHYSINGESGIKKYKINEKGNIISLVPINSEYDIITIHADDNANLKMSRVVGVVDMNF